jgi:pseudaminic acid synthase
MIKINDHLIGRGVPVYIIAEMSANHNQSLDNAIAIVKAAKEAGADAIKLQTYTADTMTIDCNERYFQIGKETIWAGKTLYRLYQEAYTPWEWHEQLRDVAKELGLDFFSTPFDNTAVDFLESLQVPAYKVASFEIVDIPLLKRIGATGKPVIVSTGMASLFEIEEAITALKESGSGEIALLKCTSAYPAPPEEMKLGIIPVFINRFKLPIGLSDHTMGISVPIAAVALGACIIEKHFTLSRSIPGPDSPFSLEPHEFKAMVEAVRTVEKALDSDINAPCPHEQASVVFRRSLFVVKDIRKGEHLTPQNIRGIRPGHGLPPKYLDRVLGKTASTDIKRGTPLSIDLIDGGAL